MYCVRPRLLMDNAYRIMQELLYSLESNNCYNRYTFNKHQVLSQGIKISDYL